MLSAKTKKSVEARLFDLTYAGKIFTGQTVAESVGEKDMVQIARYVQKLFAKHSSHFAGRYCQYVLIDLPAVYFPLPSEVAQKVEQVVLDFAQDWLKRHKGETP
jgi:hypothetical protein